VVLCAPLAGNAHGHLEAAAACACIVALFMQLVDTACALQLWCAAVVTCL
jgi:hypothetical protein